MFFYLSKILWFFVDPGNALLLLLVTGCLLTLTRFKGLGRTLVVFCILLGSVATFVPVGGWMIQSLESRFPVPQSLPDKVTGIVVLGGVLNPEQTKLRGTAVIGPAVERILESATLAMRYPEARLIYTGGSGSISDQVHKEADYVSELYAVLGVGAPQLELERESRNTWENAEKTIEMAKPKPDENWILVTSAFHMPRAVGVFRRFGWEMLPYPVDFNSDANGDARASMSMTNGLMSLSRGLHEWIGLSAYWLTGKTGSAFPKPLSPERS